MARHSNISYNVAPRYTCGSPAMVDERTAVQVAAEEKHFYEMALTGAFGEEDQTKAKTLGLLGIAEARHERPKGWDVLDLITQERFFRPFKAQCPKCLTKNVECRSGKLLWHRFKHSIYDCGGIGLNMTKKVEI
jgi:hypothetical protein